MIWSDILNAISIRFDHLVYFLVGATVATVFWAIRSIVWKNRWELANDRAYWRGWRDRGWLEHIRS
jgi:hypothetical protein